MTKTTQRKPGRSKGSNAGTVPLKLSWSSTTPWMIALLLDSRSTRAKQEAIANLTRMAKIADRYVALVDELSKEAAI